MLFDVIVGSPPYAESAVALPDGAAERQMESLRRAVEEGKVTGRESVRVVRAGAFNQNTTLNSSGGNYGHTAGQLGAMRPGTLEEVLTMLDAIVGSPPWQDQEAAFAAGKFANAEAFAAEKARRYATGEARGHVASKEAILKDLKRYSAQPYGHAAGQLGAMPPGQPEEQTMTTRQVEVQTWAGCYNGSWKGAIVPEAFSHPAKCSRGLLCRILDYLLSEGWLKRGDTLLDCFSGVATTAIEGASRGLRCIGVELEERFHLLALRNMELHRRTWEAFGDPHPILLQGDSRDLVRVLGAAGFAGVVGSPPWADGDLRGPSHAQSDTPSKQATLAHFEGKGGPAFLDKAYGTTEGQLGAMPPGDVDAVMGEGAAQAGQHERNHAKEMPAMQDSDHEQRAISQEEGGSVRGLSDSSSLASPVAAEAIIGSPPYEGSETGRPTGKGEHLVALKREALAAAGFSKEYVESLFTPGRLAHSNMGQKEHYGVSNGQLGNESGQTFWEASRIILTQCREVLREGGIAVFICKDFVRDGRRVRFSEQWARLCIACGFELFLWVKASLVSEERELSLFGGDEVKRKKKVSFFRRIHERKLAEDDERRIDHEDVIFLRKREGI